MSKDFSEARSHEEHNSDKKSKVEDDLISVAGSNCSSTKSNKRSLYSRNSDVHQLLARIAQEIDERKPSNVIHFIVDFLCKHYPEHLHGFEAIWNGDPDLEQERILVVEFFKQQKLPVEISVHFVNAGFDTIETLCTLSTNALDDIEKFNNTRWLPGHKVRLQQTFNDITNRVRMFKEERDDLIKSLKHRFVGSGTPRLLNSVVLPKVASPMILPAPPHAHPHTHPPFGVPTRAGNYIAVDKVVHPPYFYKR